MGELVVLWTKVACNHATLTSSVHEYRISVCPWQEYISTLSGSLPLLDSDKGMMNAAATLWLVRRQSYQFFPEAH